MHLKSKIFSDASQDRENKHNNIYFMAIALKRKVVLIVNKVINTFCRAHYDAVSHALVKHSCARDLRSAYHLRKR